MTEFLLLELFPRNPWQVLTRSVIFDRVWDYDFGPRLERFSRSTSATCAASRGGRRAAADPHRSRRRACPARAVSLTRLALASAVAVAGGRAGVARVVRARPPELLQSIDESLRQRTESVSVFDERLFPLRGDRLAARRGARLRAGRDRGGRHLPPPRRRGDASVAGSRGRRGRNARTVLLRRDTRGNSTSGSSPTSSWTESRCRSPARSTRSTAHRTGSPRSWRRS